MVNNELFYKHVPGCMIIKEAELLHNYALESKSNKVPTINPDIAMYDMLESKGMLECIGVYDNEILVGFITILITTMPHYATVAGTVESFYVSPEYRKFGTGKKLLCFAENAVKARGGTTLFMSAPIGSRLEVAAKFFGFSETHKSYIKDLTC